MKRLGIVDNVIQALKDEKLAVPFSIAGLWVIGRFRPEWWLEILAITVGWVIADGLLSSIFIAGEEGAVTIPLLGHLFKSEGHNYLAFLGGIVFSTWISTRFIVEPAHIWLSNTGHPVISGSVLVGGLVYYDLRVRYYGRRKTNQS